jgi:hypothetical protein
MIMAMRQNITAPLVFIGSFYCFLVGSKFLLTILVGNVYIHTLRFLGLVLCVLAFALFRDGLKLLEII